MKKKPTGHVPPVTETTLRQIREDIIMGRYKPGDHLKEKDIAAALGVSRTPVRQALRMLEQEHFVTNYPHRGTIVSGVSNYIEIEELYQVRTLVECILIRRAAVNATMEDIYALNECLDRAKNAKQQQERLDAVEQYNDKILEIAQSEQMGEVFRFIREKLRRLVASGHLDAFRSQQAATEHRRIIEALMKGDPQAAEDATRIHLANASRKRL